MNSFLSIRWAWRFAVLISVLSGLAIPSRASTGTGDPPGEPTIIIGFLGGFVRHNDAVHSVVQLAARLRKQFPADTVVETFENHSGELPHREILSLLDSNHDGNVSVQERRDARIILYGHSWGASELVELSRRLEKDGIPVRLTVQVDSVAKPGENDVVIPPNVAEAANFYQAEGWLRGESEIRAADANRTRILGNYKFSYAETPYNCVDYPWYARIFMKAHTQIECDSKVWGQVEALIQSNVASAVGEAAAH